MPASVWQQVALFWGLGLVRNLNGRKRQESSLTVR
jgi:hypothetical protein